MLLKGMGPSVLTKIILVATIAPDLTDIAIGAVQSQLSTHSTTPLSKFSIPPCNFSRERSEKIVFG